MFTIILPPASLDRQVGGSSGSSNLSIQLETSFIVYDNIEFIGIPFQEQIGNFFPQYMGPPKLVFILALNFNSTRVGPWMYVAENSLENDPFPPSLSQL